MNLGIEFEHLNNKENDEEAEIMDKIPIESQTVNLTYLTTYASFRLLLNHLILSATWIFSLLERNM